jgi:hypothetical protein
LDRRQSTCQHARDAGILAAWLGWLIGVLNSDEMIPPCDPVIRVMFGSARAHVRPYPPV